MVDILSFLRRLRISSDPRTRTSRRNRLSAPESLEPRILLFAATGNAWANPQLVTISFMPDGTNLGGQVSNLNAAFNAKPALNGQWQNQILKAAQTWAQQTNLNFAVVTDNAAASGAGNYQQGDPGFGDIRIGGYAFGNSNLARAYAPPPINNYSIAGDIAFNTSIGFNIGSSFDLFTVATHEFGHALGLDHTSTSSSAMMYSAYNSAKTSLNADDIAGIKSIYSGTAARSKDAYDAAAANETSATATNVTSQINATTKTAVLNNLDITTTADIDYLKFTAPAGSSSTLKVTVQSSGLSLLAPKAWVYNASNSQLATVTGTGFQGSTLTMTVNGIVAGQTYYVKVDGADATAFGTGRYAVTLNMGSGANPTVTKPNTQVEKGSPLSGSGGIAAGSGSNDDLLSVTPVITAITTDTGASSADRVTSDRTLVISGFAPESFPVTVFRNGVLVGTTVTDGHHKWSLDLTGTSLSDGTFSFTASSTDPLGTVSSLSGTFTVTIDNTAPNTPVISGFSPDSGVVGDSTTNVKRPTLSGTAAAGTQITVFRDGSSIGTTTTSGSGLWNYALTNDLNDTTYNFTVTATDLAGNASGLSNPQRISVDTTGPSKPIVSTMSPDTGVAGDQITLARNLSFSGIAEAFSTINVWIDGVNSASGTTNSSGTWSVNSTTTTLSVGSHSITATAIDPAGNASDLSSAFALTVRQSIAPVIVSITPDTNISGDGITNLKRPTLLGTVEPGSVVSIYRDSSLKGTVTADASGQWSFAHTSDLSNGSYGFTVKATDVAGNVSALSSVYQVTIDTDAPAVPIIGGVEKISTTALVVHGIAESLNKIQVTLNGVVVGTTNADAAGNWSYTHNSAADGTYNFSGVSTDVAGNVGAVSATFNLLIGAGAAISSTPVISAASDTGIKGDGITATTNPVLTGTASPGSKVTILNGKKIVGTVTANSSGVWTFNCSTLSLGIHKFSSFATDSLGRKGLMSSLLTLTIQTTIV